MYCPRCGTMVEVGTLICRQCDFHFNEPFYPQARKGQHSMMWWFVIIIGGLMVSSILLSVFLYLMVMWGG
jgi:hypothetical protein